MSTIVLPGGLVGYLKVLYHNWLNELAKKTMTVIDKNVIINFIIKRVNFYFRCMILKFNALK